ncbi:MAG: tyrosine-type recombinase/integrase [Oscillospiraceae bacterium]|nr:tyrosine-type recombinase/integrase [Oscillospiraceae bacterium]
MKRRVITNHLLNSFEKYLIENEKAGATIEKYMRDMRRFENYAAESILDKTVVLSYKSMLEQNYAIRSANSMLAALNAFLRFVGWYDLCVKQFKVQKEAYCSEEKELSKIEYTALVKAAELKKNKRLSLVVQTICSTGIRVSELQNITVEAVRRGEAVVSCKGKSRKIFIVKALQKKLLHYAMEQGITAGSLFITKNGKPLNRSNIWRQMKELCKQAGVSPKKVFPHNLRHLFARTFYGIEKDIAKLADILGHSNINTTRIYIITTGAEHQRRMENMRLII